MKHRVLITGGAGFIGSHMTEHMLAQGHRVAVADRFTYAGKGRNLQAVLPQIELLIGDLAAGDLPGRCAAWEPDWVIHMAAETHVDRAISDPDLFMHSNVLGTTRLLQALHMQATVRPSRIVVYSTDEVFGSTRPGVAYAETQPFNPSNAYAASKVAVEAVANSFYRTHEMPISIVRPCNTYGPRQHPEKAIPRFVAQALAREPMTLYNDGFGSRDWLHTSDHCRAVETVLERGEPGQAYNMAAGESHTDLEIASGVAAIVGEFTREIIMTPRLVRGRPGHDKHYLMTSERLRALGWKPIADFKAYFADTVRWNMENQDWWQHDGVTYGNALPAA